jgi:excisionase family DNA binding protein
LTARQGKRIKMIGGINLETERLTMSVPEAARALGISRGHAFAMVHSGELPSLRLGKRLLVPVDALRRMVNAAASSLLPAA